MSIASVLIALWALWLASWLGAALWASRASTRPRLQDEALYRGVSVLGALLVFWDFGRGDALGWQLWATPQLQGWLLVAVAMLGLAFTWWARLHLGMLWSGSVTRKADHRIIESGPYGMVRHPIYTGVLVALYATALERGSVSALAGVAIMTLGFVVKARLEERFLGAELGGDLYASYRRRVPMLVPFWRAG